MISMSTPARALACGDEVRAVGRVTQGAGAGGEDGGCALLPRFVGEAGNGVQSAAHGGVGQAFGLSTPSPRRVTSDVSETTETVPV